MSITYLVDDFQYVLSYKKLKDNYETFCLMPDEVFLEKLPSALHLACMICYLKESPLEQSISDTGIIHELVHLLDIPEDSTTHLNTIRDKFEKTLKLS